MDQQNNTDIKDLPILVETPRVSPSSPTPPVTTPTRSNTSSKKVGPIIAIFVVVIIVIAAILYFIGANSNKQIIPPADNSPVATQQADVNRATTSVQPITNSTDDIQSLQNDLNNSTTGIDSQNF